FCPRGARRAPIRCWRCAADARVVRDEPPLYRRQVGGSIVWIVKRGLESGTARRIFASNPGSAGIKVMPHTTAGCGATRGSGDGVANSGAGVDAGLAAFPNHGAIVRPAPPVPGWTDGELSAP
ncbi:MAG: hypothetical protein ACHQO8_12155, partial [Vicinamibacterales bacterium]